MHTRVIIVTNTVINILQYLTHSQYDDDDKYHHSYKVSMDLCNIKPCNDVPKWRALHVWCITVMLCFWRGKET